MVVEKVDATQIAILADSIEHYKVLKCLTLKKFLCGLPEAERLWELLGKMENLETVQYLQPGNEESLRVMNEARKSCKSQVSFKQGENNVEETPEWRDKRRHPEPKIPRFLRLLDYMLKNQLIPLLQEDYSTDQARAVLIALTRSVQVKQVRLFGFAKGDSLKLYSKELGMLLRSETSVEIVEVDSRDSIDERFQSKHKDLWKFDRKIQDRSYYEITRRSK